VNRPRRPDWRSVVPWVCLVGVELYFGLRTPEVLTSGNLLNVVGQAAPLIIVAVGQLFVIVSGGFDISIGSIAALSAVVSAQAVNHTGGYALLVAPAVGLACGLANGVLVGRWGLQPIVATLGMLAVARGLSLLMSSDSFVAFSANNPLFALAYSRTAGVPNAFLFAAGCAAFAALVTNRLRFGRRLYFIGSNADGARLLGTPVGSTLVWAYGVSGLSAGLATLVYLGRAGGAAPTEGNGLELAAIAAAVIGGTALSGGVGRVLGVVVAAVFIQGLANGLGLTSASPFLQETILGAVIVGAGLVDFAARQLSRNTRTQEVLA
jgi:ribose/xylose/arabinose/galactoside ABC-type transport system permease subunit